MGGVKRMAEKYESQRKKIRLQSDVSQQQQSERSILTLPDEMVVKIFSYLQRNDILMGAALVCTEWRRLSMATELWNRIAEFEASTKTALNLLKQSNHVKVIILYQCSFIDDSVISEIAKQEMLKTLILARCEGLSLTPKMFGSLAKCRALQQLDLTDIPVTDSALEMIAKSYPKLTYLGLEGCSQITAIGLLSVIEYCPRLKDLILNRCENLTDSSLMAMAILDFTVERLEIADCNFSEKGLKYLEEMPQLKCVNATRVSSICDRTVHIFSNLKYLLLDGVDITNRGVLTILRNNPNLELLRIASMAVDNTAMEYISTSPCRSTLVCLNVVDCSVSDDGVRRILRNCTKLQNITYSVGTKEGQEKLQLEFPEKEIHLFNRELF